VDWPTLVRRYVWDEEKTPYLVGARSLTPAQARSELFVYAFLLAILASVVVLLAALGRAGPGAAFAAPVALYAVTILVGAAVLGWTGHPAAARYCATAPLVVALGALLGALRPGMTSSERVVLGAFGVLWLGYAGRIVRIARRLRGGE
jgi:hypothetical protein